MQKIQPNSPNNVQSSSIFSTKTEWEYHCNPPIATNTAFSSSITDTFPHASRTNWAPTPLFLPPHFILSLLLLSHLFLPIDLSRLFPSRQQRAFARTATRARREGRAERGRGRDPETRRRRAVLSSVPAVHVRPQGVRDEDRGREGQLMREGCTFVVVVVVVVSVVVVVGILM